MGDVSSSLSHSLTRDRRGGLASTEGRLSVSFIDQKGLGAAMIGDILSAGADFDDDDDNFKNNNKGDEGPKDRQKSMEELLGVGPPSDDDEDNNGKRERKISFDESGGGTSSSPSPRSSMKSSINRRRGLTGLRTIESQRVLE